eukprot:TRINITY_DN6467_c0_g1_i1.p1 TRINITY_DN6467_c0_g1~~TRINITY_DN6467_c0_g1_i1.p1  ORF type:complete len:473 (-),score=64.06 TRINITY_DN6467_c0_g1_i1:215-1633(-)
MRLHRRFGPMIPWRGMSKWGQPHRDTHPHLLTEDTHINKGLTFQEFLDRRQRLVELFFKNGFERGLLVLPGACTTYMSDKIPYLFRQNTDFRYFTGCLEPLSALTIDLSNSKSTLFLRDSDPRRELWEGPSTSLYDAVSYFHVSEALPMSQFSEHVAEFRKKAEDPLLFDPGSTPEWSLHKSIKEFHCSKPFSRVVSPSPMIHAIRCIKSPSEIELMRTSATIASHAISKTMQATPSLESESDLFASVDYYTRINNGSNFLAYPPVVASGKNANIIHYIANNSALKPNELILMDAGGEYHGYASDITRTWPTNGTFTPAQRVLYELVYEVQTSLIRRLVQDPSRESIDSLYRLMMDELRSLLQFSGILRGSAPASLAQQLCPHHVSHYLGMDVHDTPHASKENWLSPGMVITIEPGIYIPRNKFKDTIREEFLDIGIRIEDDVLITKSGIDVLTKECPKTIDEIEEVMKSLP